MADKKLIATTVSSREKGIRRREEGGTYEQSKDDFTTRETKNKAGIIS